MDTSENHNPDDHEVVEQESQHPIMTPVNCGNCGAQFEFPTGGISSFGFDCTNCGAHSHIELGGE